MDSGQAGAKLTLHWHKRSGRPPARPNTHESQSREVRRKSIGNADLNCDASSSLNLGSQNRDGA
jgi:hypothetical protein